MNYAIIIGASSGLGKESAKQLAREHNIDELWLVARREDRLKDLATTISKSTRVFVLDICQDSDLEKLSRANSEYSNIGHTLTWLVLAAGRGVPGRFDDTNDQSEYLSTINLNVLALTKVAKLLLPDLHGNALLFASVAAFLPQPAFAVYAATKSYVLSLSRALNCEFKNATITAVCPNPVETEFFLQGGSAREISRIKSIGIESAENVISHAIKRAKRGKDIAISSPIARTINFFSKLLPHSFILKMGQKLNFFEH